MKKRWTYWFCLLFFVVGVSSLLSGVLNILETIPNFWVKLGWTFIWGTFLLCVIDPPKSETK
jgi:hypothetical protein